MTAEFTDTRQWIFVNGHASSGLPPQDRGFLYGDGLFETMRISNGRIPLLSFHLDRLLRSCHRLAIDISQQRVGEEINQCLADIKKNGCLDARMRLTITRGAGSSASYPEGCSPPNLTLHVAPVTAQIPVAPVELVAANRTLPSYPLLAGVKHLNRLPYVLGCLNITRAAGQEIFFCDDSGRVIETLHHNIFFIQDQNLITPKIDTCGVAGVMRHIILSVIADACGFKAVEMDVELNRVTEFDACFITNAVAGLLNVSAMPNTRFLRSDRVDPILAQLQKFLETQ